MSTLDPPPNDPYAPPAAALADYDVAEAPRFYVVSSAKFWTLTLATVGLYGVYWTYRHWAHFKRATRGDEWPVMRAIFQIFFMHSLANEIDRALVRNGVRHDWLPQLLATGAVVAMVATRILDRLPDTTIPDDTAFLLQAALIPVIGVFKWRMQLAANAACGDPAGAGNRAFTGGNIAWIAVGALFWLLVFAGLMLPEEAAP